MNKTVELSKIENGKTFEIGNVEFIKFSDKDGTTIAVTKDCVFSFAFGNNTNFAESRILERLNKDFLPKIGEENICEFETDLTTLDGLKTFGMVKSKVGLVTLDFYRENVDIFDNYKLNNWWWLATAWSANPHWNTSLILCVSSFGGVSNCYCHRNGGVRPFLHFVSSISVSCNE